jgi:hypothetical protein
MSSMSHNLFFDRLEVLAERGKRHRAAQSFVDAQLGGNAGDDEESEQSSGKADDDNLEIMTG